MRDLLTYFGIGLILVLTALLGAPYVVDFDAHRSRFAEEISHVTGARAQLDGPIAFRFLPTPYFSAQNLSLTGPLGAIRIGKAEFELSLTGLLQGRLNFTRAEIFLADIALDGDQLRRPVAAAQFEKLAIHDAVVRISHAGTTLFTLDAVDFAGTIPTFDGPYDGRGVFTLRGEKITYSIASGAFVGQSLPLKLILTASGDRARGQLDGALDLSAPAHFIGKLNAEGAAAAGAWQAEGDVAARLEGVAAVDKAILRLGEGVQAAKLAGNARYDALKETFAVDLAAPRLGGPWADWVAGAAARASTAKSPVAFRLAIDALDWRGAWSQVQFSRDFSAPARVRAEGAGGARIEATATPDAQNVWRGRVDFSANDFPAFDASSAAPPLPFHQVACAGDFTLSNGALTLGAGRIALDRAKFTGDFSWAPAKADARAKFAARLSGAGLDPSAAPDFVAALSGDMDLDLTLDAQTLGKSDGKLSLRLSRDQTGSRLEKLEARNIAGADFAASGEWTGAFANPKGVGQIRTRDLGEFAALLARLTSGSATGDATRQLAARATLLSPASLNARAGDGGYAFDGQLAATRISAALDAKGSVSLDIAAPEAFSLLAQLGAPPLLAPQKLGPAHIALVTTGEAGHPIVTGKADLGRIHGAFTGGWRGESVAGDLSLDGDPSALLGGPSGAGQVKAQVEARDGRVLLRQIEGQRGDSHFAGDLVLSSEGVDGALDVSQFSAPAFIALTLGAPAPVRTGFLWSKLSFSPVLVDPPHARLAIRAAEVAPFGVPAQFDLTLAPNALSVAKLEATVNGGTLRGGFDLRRQAGQATLAGEVSAENVSLKNPALAATIAGRLKFAGSGANMAALMGALAGSGAGHVADLKIVGVAPEAPEQVLASQAANEAPFNAASTARDLDQALAGGDLRIANGEAALRLAEGKIRTARDGAAFSYDLNDLTFSLVSTVAAKAGGRAELAWSGDWEHPARKLDATGFVTLAATRALEREQARIARQREEDRARQREIIRQRELERERQKQLEREKAAPESAPAASGEVVAKPAASEAGQAGPQ